MRIEGFRRRRCGNDEIGVEREMEEEEGDLGEVPSKYIYTGLHKNMMMKYTDKLDRVMK